MLQKLQQHINYKFPFLKDTKLLIAISGGIDSVVLTHLLSSLKFNISLAHCNFNLRGKESDLDEIFVKELAIKLDIKCFTTSFKTEEFAATNKQSTQIAARNLRYTWFQKIINKHTFDYVLTAHHADDNLETFLINLTRGTGLDGLTGIPEINKNIIRPLLVFSSKEINKYAITNNIQWREDQSNASIKYTRNKIRHKVLPTLKEINPSILDTFTKTVENLKESATIVHDQIAHTSKSIITQKEENFHFNINKIKQLPNPKAYLFQYLKKYSFTEFNDITKLLTAQTGKQVFSKTHVLLKNRNTLILSKIDDSSKTTTFYIDENQSEIKNPIHLKIKETTFSSTNTVNEITVSKNSLKFPLVLRKWQNGDYFFPTGMQGRKKISKYFKDEKLSVLEKEQTWLLCNNDNTIIWVIGKRQDNRFTNLNQETKQLQIKFM